MIVTNYWNCAWRSLTKKKGFSVVNIVGLAIGMAAALLILTYVAFEYSYDDMHSRQDRIFRVEARFYENGELTDDWASSSAGYATAMKQNMSAVEAYTRVGSQYYPEQVVKYNELLYRETGIGYAEANFFDFFDFKLLKGNKESCLDGPNKVVITERIARKYFKGADPIGKILIFRSNIGEEACEVTGIMEDMPINTHIRYNLLISYKTLPKWMDEYWYRHEVYSYVLLKSANLKTQVEEDFPVMAEKYKTEEALKNKTWAIQLTNLRDIHLNPQKAYEPEVKGNRSSIWVLICTALAILCIAWINYINMTVARSMERAKEIGIRRASGASRRQVISQFLFESLVTNSIAFILAIGLMEALMPSFNNLTAGSEFFRLVYDFTGVVSVADLCCRCVSVRLLPGDGFVRHQADPDVERKVYPYAWGDGHPQGFGGVAIHGFSGVALRDVDRVRATSIYAECFFGGTGGPDAGS